MDEKNINALIENLLEERCIICVGPEIERETDTQSKKAAFYQKLADENPESVLAYNAAEELFLFTDGDTKADIQKAVKQFYKNDYGKQVYATLAQLPFHVLINCSPDITLKRLFESQKQAFVFDFFEKERRRNLDRIPTRNIPLVYNIFGNVQHDESLVLSHDDLFTYLRNVLIEDRLPDELRNALKNARSFLFIGFQFDKWYVQLLLRLFKLDDKVRSFKRYSVDSRTGGDTQIICSKDFKIQSFGSTATELVNTLFARLQSMENEGTPVLRKPQTADAATADPLKTANAERLQTLQEQLKRLEKLRSDYEDKQLFEDDPKKLMEIEETLKKLVQKIEEIRKEIMTYA